MNENEMRSIADWRMIDARGFSPLYDTKEPDEIVKIYHPNVKEPKKGQWLISDTLFNGSDVEVLGDSNEELTDKHYIKMVVEPKLDEWSLSISDFLANIRLHHYSGWFQKKKQEQGTRFIPEWLENSDDSDYFLMAQNDSDFSESRYFRGLELERVTINAFIKDGKTTTVGTFAWKRNKDPEGNVTGPALFVTGWKWR